MGFINFADALQVHLRERISILLISWIYMHLHMVVANEIPAYRSTYVEVFPIYLG